MICRSASSSLVVFTLFCPTRSESIWFFRPSSEEELPKGWDDDEEPPGVGCGFRRSVPFEPFLRPLFLGELSGLEIVMAVTEEGGASGEVVVVVVVVRTAG